MIITHHTPLVLASGSAIRAQMLKSVGLQFSVAPSNVDEEEVKRESEIENRELAIALARAKALNVSPSYCDHLTIGADQLCVLNTHIFDKPGDAKTAIRQLQQLSDQAHEQISAVCIAKGEEIIWEHVESAELTMRKLNIAEIESYVAADQPLKSCGAYKYESLGKHLFSQVEGNDSVIKGLPLQALIAKLHALGAIALGE